MLGSVYTKLLDMSIQGSIVILVVLLLRLLIRRLPKVFSYFLWSVVLFRLLCPISIEAPVSILPDVEPVSQSYTLTEEPISFASAGVAAYQAVGDALNGGLDVQYIHTEERDELGYRETVTASWWEVWVLLGQYIWLLGVMGFAVYSLVSWLCLRRRLVGSMHLQDNIYLADHIPTPFVMGIIKPKIYLPSSLVEEERIPILAHEQHHIRRLDHVAKLFAFTALALHWFNPLVWLAYIFFCKDMEMSCDEAVLKKLGPEIRGNYAASLLRLTTGKTGVGIMPLAFGEGDTKGRIRNLSKWKKHRVWVLCVAGSLVAVMTALLLLSPQKTVDEKLSVFVDCQIAEKHQSKETGERARCLDWEVLGMEKTGKKTTLYLWVLYEEYIVEADLLKKVTAFHTPTVITAREQEGQYILEEYWVPGDGSNYAPDIENKFPWYLESKAKDSQRYIDKQQAECEEMARDYFAAKSAQPGGTNVAEAFDTVIVYAGYTGEAALIARALNVQSLSSSSLLHLPIYKFDTKQELDDFTAEFGKFLSLNEGYEEVPSFYTVAKGYNEAFFSEYTLMMVYITASSGSYRYGVDSIYCGINNFCIHVKQTERPMVHTDDMAGWFVLVGVPDSMVRNVERFDADLNNAVDYDNHASLRIEKDTQNNITGISGYAPKTDFSQLSQKVKNALADEWQAYDLLTPDQRSYSSRMYGHITFRADTWQQSETDLGININNPVADISWLTPTDVYGGTATSEEILHTEVAVYATDAEERQVERISISAGYRGDGLRVILKATVFAENAIFLKSTAEGSVYDGSVYTGTGIAVDLIRDSGEAYTAVSGYWIEKNVCYDLRVIGENGQEAQVYDTLKELLKEI